MKAARTTRRFLVAVAMLLLLTACGAEGGASPDGEPAGGGTPAGGDDTAPAGTEAEGGGDPTPVRVASILSGQAGYLTALVEHMGLGEEHGLDLEVTDLGFVEAANALRQDRADVALMSVSSIVSLRGEQGFESVIVGPSNWSGNAWVVREDAPYEDFADLQGERIGNFPRTTGAFFFSAVLADAMDLSIEDDFDSVEADVSALVALLENGEVEAVNLFEPHVSKLLTIGGYRVLLDFDEFFEELMGARPLKATYAATPQWIEENPDTVEAVQAVLAEAIEAIKSGADEEFFRDNADELFGLTTAEQVDAGFERNRLSYVGPDEWREGDVEVQNQILQEGIDLGLLPEPPEDWQEDMWLDCYYEQCPSG
ncbi:MAG: PhnD/SsuA/transferrin family substrate-binding protein [Nitriliruptorales bacterium]|nr:PhnD/SsuA/transferrin family substrate-binding protein [Nitriliruptorales bacterium]